MKLQTRLEKYIEATKKHGEATVSLDSYREINKAYSAILKNFKALVYDDEGKKLLRSLLNYENKYVSSWTATLLIFEFPDECENIICEAIKENGIWAGTMRTFYEEWKEGNIKKLY